MQHRRGKRGQKFSRDQGRRAKGYLPEDTIRYYRHVSDALRDGFETEEEKSLFLNNAVKQLSEEVILVSQNQTVSRIIESLATQAKPKHLRKLLIAITADLSVAFLDRFASHVLQTLIQLVLPQFYSKDSSVKSDTKTDEEKEAEDGDDEDNIGDEEVLESVQSVCKFVDKHFETVVTHTYGSHVMRALLESLSGVPVAHEIKRGHSSKDSHHASGLDVTKVQKGKPPAEFAELFKRYVDRIFRFCDYEVLLKDSSFSPILQTVLLILHRTDPKLCQTHCHTLIQRMMENQPESDDPAASIPDMAQNQVGSYMLEVVFKLSSPDLLKEIYSTVMKGKLLYFAIHPVANFVLQRFICFLKDKELLESVFEELSKIVEDILAVGHMGLVTNLADACRRLQLKQEEFISTLMEAFHCKEPEERQSSFPRLVLSLTAYEVFFKVDEQTGKPPEGAEEPVLSGPVNMHGSLLLQQLLQFDKQKFVAPAIAAMKPAELCMLCTDPAGSHVVDTFFSSHTVYEKNKEFLLKKLKGLFMEVACTKNGSRCLESIWLNLNVKQRARIASELVENEARLRGDRFGHFLHRNLALTQFVQKREQWFERQGAQSKRKRMVAELLHHKDFPAKKMREDEEDPSHIELQEEEDPVTALFTKSVKNAPQEDKEYQVSQDSDTVNDSHSASPDRNKVKKAKKHKKSMAGKEGNKGTKKSAKDSSEKTVQRQDSDSDGDDVNIEDSEEEDTKQTVQRSETLETKKWKKKQKKLELNPFSRRAPATQLRGGRSAAKRVKKPASAEEGVEKEQDSEGGMPEISPKKKKKLKRKLEAVSDSDMILQIGGQKQKSRDSLYIAAEEAAPLKKKAKKKKQKHGN